MATPHELISAAAAGDEDAFREIVEGNQRIVRSFVFGLTADMDVADELTQQTFVEAYRALGSFRGDVKLSTWLCGIAHNRVRQFRRSARRRDVAVAALEWSGTKAQSLDPEGRLLTRELQNVVTTVLARLSSGHRLAFTLKVLDGRTYEEVAEITGASVDKLKTDVHRARAALRDALKPWLDRHGML